MPRPNPEEALRAGQVGKLFVARGTRGENIEDILTLARDMGVNLAGIEIILNMREKMIEMERQMSEFAHVVQQELCRIASQPDEKTPKHAIVRMGPKVVKT